MGIVRKLQEKPTLKKKDGTWYRIFFINFPKDLVEKLGWAGKDELEITLANSQDVIEIHNKGRPKIRRKVFLRYEKLKKEQWRGRLGKRREVNRDCRLNGALKALLSAEKAGKDSQFDMMMKRYKKIWPNIGFDLNKKKRKDWRSSVLTFDRKIRLIMGVEKDRKTLKNKFHHRINRDREL
jgi:hypothetical protein